MTQNELDIILKAHKRWLSDKKGGWQADLQNDDLQDADFRGADLRYANLYGANLWNADFQGADIDYSCWPLWCGSLNVKVDRRIFCQLAYHLCRVIVDDDDSCLVWNGNHIFVAIYWGDDEWMFDSYACEITHWMPLPEPPKEDNQ